MKRALLLVLILLVLVNVAEAKTFTVNFMHVTTEFPSPKAYWGHKYDSAPSNPSSESTPSSDYTEFSQNASYQEIASRDGIYIYYEDAETYYFVFRIPTSATSISVNWYGCANDGNDYVYLYAFNWTSNSWDYLDDYYGDSWGWLNKSLGSQHISQNGYVHVAFVAYRNNGWDSYAEFPTDYVELVVDVPDYDIIPACVDYDDSTAPRPWDGFLEYDTISVQARATNTTGETIPYYYSFYLKAEWDSNSGIFGSGVADSTGWATVSGRPIDGGVTDEWRVTLKVGVGDAIVNGVAYEASPTCGEKAFASNVAITPKSYNLTLVGRYYDANGIDWAYINWKTRPSNVAPVNIGGYNLPVSVKFNQYSWELYVWKIGANNVPGNLNNDPDGDVEGVNGNVNEVTSEHDMYPAYYAPDDVPFADPDGNGGCRNARTPITEGDRYPAGCCMRENWDNYVPGESPPIETGDCGQWMSGYRIGPLMEFNSPAHNLGEPGKASIFLCSEFRLQDEDWGSLSGMLNSTPYSGHEGDGTNKGRLRCTGCGLWSLIEQTTSPGATEYIFANDIWVCSIFSLANYLVVHRHPYGGLGTINFVGLIPDSDHVVGIMMGHRFGIHPFVAVVTSMPPPGTSPTPPLSPASNWDINFLQVWLYYLLRNLAYGIVVTADEWMHMSDRFPESGEDNVELLAKAFVLMAEDLLPTLEETLWILQASGNNTLNPFWVSMVSQFNDTKRIATLITVNQTLRAEFMNTVGTLFYRLPDILGPPNASTGLNYFLNGTVNGLTYEEKRSIVSTIYSLLDETLSLIITTLHRLPYLEYVNDPYSPGWNFNWIENSG